MGLRLNLRRQNATLPLMTRSLILGLFGGAWVFHARIR
jgi:hypothetical protein